MHEFGEIRRTKKITRIIAVVLCLLLFCFSVALFKKIKKESESVITFSLYPYLINYDYCKECIEEAWKEIHPDIELQLVEYDCYSGERPENVDVIMFDAVLESFFVEQGYLAPISENDIADVEDFFDYALEDTRVDGKLYGIPAFLCADFYIYDKSDRVSAEAASIYDLAGNSNDVLMHSLENDNYGLIMDVNADRTGRYIIDEEIDNTEGKKIIDDMKTFGNEEYFEANAYQVASVYDNGVGVGYFGYSETLSLMENRYSQSAVKMISYSQNENIPLFYEDLAGISPYVGKDKKKLCLELINLISSTEMMEKLAINDGAYSYLIFPRKSMYSNIVQEDGIYQGLYECVTGENNHILRYPASCYSEAAGTGRKGPFWHARRGPFKFGKRVFQAR